MSAETTKIPIFYCQDHWLAGTKASKELIKMGYEAGFGSG
jgi:CRISPR/Cas system endoribonuclease Cas6 (RAMP superfamily)